MESRGGGQGGAGAGAGAADALVRRPLASGWEHSADIRALTLRAPSLAALSFWSEQTFVSGQLYPWLHAEMMLHKCEKNMMKKAKNGFSKETRRCEGR